MSAPGRAPEGSPVSTYVVLITGDENAWGARTEAENDAVGEAHGAFVKALVERGHHVGSALELTHSRESRVARREGEGFVVTEGPYVESVEQLGGLYVVETSDPDDLISLVGTLALTERAVEIRPVVDFTGRTS